MVLRLVNVFSTRTCCVWCAWKCCLCGCFQAGWFSEYLVMEHKEMLEIDKDDLRQENSDLREQLFATRESLLQMGKGSYPVLVKVCKISWSTKYAMHIWQAYMNQVWIPMMSQCKLTPKILAHRNPNLIQLHTKVIFNCSCIAGDSKAQWPTRLCRRAPI